MGTQPGLEPSGTCDYTEHFKMIPSRWEFGSDFHVLPGGECCAQLRPAAPGRAALRAQPVAPETTRASLPAEAHPHSFWSSGRDALVALLQWGKSALSLQRLWCPSYVGQPLLEAARNVDLTLAVYPDSPLQPAADLSQLELRTGDAILSIGYFGLRGPSVRRNARRSPHIYIIEDHTHDPWSGWAAGSQADFCFASLRKTLPVPDGAVLWSPRSWNGPTGRGFQQSRAAGVLNRLSGMLLKSAYLEGAAVEKTAFRACLMAGEDAFSSPEPSGMSSYTAAFLRGFDAKVWRERRAANHAEFSAALAEDPVSGFRLLPELETGGVPFCVTLLFQSVRLRDSVRLRLGAAGVYSSLVWHLDEPILTGVPEQHIQLSRELLAVPCDGRYTSQDIRRVVAELRKATRAELTREVDSRDPALRDPALREPVKGEKA